MIIDDLVLTLQLDPTKYTEAEKKFLEGLNRTKQEAGKTAEELEAKGAQGASFFDQMSSSALKLGAVLLGGIGIKDFLESTTRAGNSAGYMAKNIGISVQELGLWRGVVRQAGGDAEQVAPALLGLSQALTTIALRGPGSGDLLATLQALGVTPIDRLTGRIKTVTELLPELHAAFQKVSPAVAFNLGTGIGLTPDMINALSQSDPIFQQYLKNMRAAGTLTDQQVKAAQDLTAAWANMLSFFDRVGYEFAGEIDPVLTKTTAIITSLGEALDSVGSNFAASDLGAFIGGILGFLVGGPVGAAAGVIIGGGAGAFLGGPAATSYSNDSYNAQYGTGAPAAPGAGGDKLFGLFRQLEGGKENTVTPTGNPNDPYAYGLNQITLATALKFDPQATAAKLLNGSYNDALARKIEAQYSSKYGGNLDAIALAYHNGPGAADRFVASGGSTAGLGPQTLAYLSRERALAGGGNGPTTTTTTIGTINVNAPKATDAAGIAGAIRSELAASQLISQGNAGPQ